MAGPLKALFGAQNSVFFVVFFRGVVNIYHKAAFTVQTLYIASAN